MPMLKVQFTEDELYPIDGLGYEGQTGCEKFIHDAIAEKIERENIWITEQRLNDFKDELTVFRTTDQVVDGIKKKYSL